MERKSRFIKPASADVRIVPAKPEHGPGVYRVICLANGFDPQKAISGVFGLGDWQTALARFPDGQFVALNADGEVLGVALALRTSYAPKRPPKSWREMIGDLSLSKHEPKGRWLYGTEKAVLPSHQGRGIGRLLYEAQFELAKRLNLRGIYAGGMLKGYRAHKDHMSLREYASKVIKGDLFDPTISVQIRRGFKPRSLIENYVWDHQCEHTGLLIVWENPDYRRVLRPALPEKLGPDKRRPSTLQAAL